MLYSWTSLIVSGITLFGVDPSVQPQKVLPSLTELLAETDHGQRVDFSDQIHPILSNKCFACHGPDAATRKAGLRLDLESGATTELKSGGRAVVAGDLSASSLIQRIVSEDPGDRMPPEDFNKHLTPDEVRLFARWIGQGAEWEQHWSFVAPQRPALPEVSDAGWSRNPIDNFILSRLDRDGITPSREAEPHVLARRAALAVTGLPPDPRQVEALQSGSMDYESFVDSLFESPSHGEHMARYWLDAARYADTNGYHIDNERYMWRWRDWVIDAFNQNMPFDEFTIDQLAGDLLDNPTMEQRLASGFNRNHMISFEAGILDEEYQVHYVVDRVVTTGTVWLGLSLSCAQCHSHKYDPISNEEFYRFFAYFNTIEEKGRDGHYGNSDPFMKAPRPEDEQRIHALEDRLTSLKDAIEAPDAEMDAGQSGWEESQGNALATQWHLGKQLRTSVEGEGLASVQPDGFVAASTGYAKSSNIRIEQEVDIDTLTAVSIELIPDIRFPLATIADCSIEVAPKTGGEWALLEITQARADVQTEKHPVANVFDGKPETGWVTEGPGPRSAWLFPSSPFSQPGGLRIRATIQLADSTQADIRIRFSDDPALTPSRPGRWYLSGPHSALNPMPFAVDAAIDLEGKSDDGVDLWEKVEKESDGVIRRLQGDNATYYIYREIETAGPRDLRIDLGDNDATTVFVNGRQVFDKNARLDAEPVDSTSVAVPLEAGSNQLLLRITNFGRPRDFYYAVQDEHAQEGLPFPVATALMTSPVQRSEAQRLRLLHHYRAQAAPEWQQRKDEVERAAVELRIARENVPTVMVMHEMDQPRETHILERGQYDQPKERVEPGIPAVFPSLPPGEPNNRLGLARWMVSRENPLTARVTVNRLWQQVFGTGLVKTVEEFGAQGELPSHPELLDWLAVEFMDSGWDVRHILRLMVNSATFRQDSRITPESLEQDPENRLLARGPRFRMDAEMVRDNILAVSGLLVDRPGGPSVKTYHPSGVWEEVSFGGGHTAQRYVQDLGDDLYRRSMYTFWKRQAPPPDMLIFDAPTRETCVVRRARTNTPMQALALLNGPQYVEAARFLAQRTLEGSGDAATPEERIREAFRLSLFREAKPPELEALLELYEDQLERFEREPESASEFLSVGDNESGRENLVPAELAAWTVVANVMLNLDETSTYL